jgi:hypothetical protein|tara:strand:- start:19 stop:165 length:147 start_codon:yes stop_codon:yes gene_type:complete
VRRSVISAQTYEPDKREIAQDPDSDIRFFVAELSPGQIANYKAENGDG